MPKRLVIVILIVLLGCNSAEPNPPLAAVEVDVPAVTRTVVPSPTWTLQPTQTNTPTSTPTNTPTHTPSPTDAPTSTPTITPSPTFTATAEFEALSYMCDVATPTAVPDRTFLFSVVDLGPEPLQTFNAPSAPLCSADIAAWEIGHLPDTVAHITAIADNTTFLDTPRDLAFNPLNPSELWIINKASNSIAIVDNTFSDSRTIHYLRDGTHDHFMHRPAAIAFGGTETTFDSIGTFATIQESRNRTYELDFMGPTLFTSDRSVFAQLSNSSHLDMLHGSPLGMGIAWERDNVYWVYGGHFQTIAQYDFRDDHGPGNDDHSDGVIRHYMSGMIESVDGVPSHLAFHHATNTLFIADTGNRRVLQLHTTSGTLGDDYENNPDEVDSRYVDDAQVDVIVSAEYGLQAPSGLAIVNDILYIGDNATGKIHTFTLDGEPLNVINTDIPEGGLMGLAHGEDGKLYFVDAHWSRVLRLDCVTQAATMESE